MFVGTTTTYRLRDRIERHYIQAGWTEPIFEVTLANSFQHFCSNPVCRSKVSALFSENKFVAPRKLIAQAKIVGAHSGRRFNSLRWARKLPLSPRSKSGQARVHGYSRKNDSTVAAGRYTQRLLRRSSHRAHGERHPG